MNHIWQNIPSMAFKKGLYDGISTVGEVRKHGDFGVGQFSALDGELIVLDGSFYRARSDGSVHLAEELDELCFAQLCYFRPEHTWDAPPNVNEQSFGSFLGGVLSFRNSFCAFRIRGLFANVVATSPPKLSKPYPPFDAVPALRKSFPVANIHGCIVGFYSPAFTEDIGIPGYHYHFISDDRSSAGHVISFSLTSGQVDAVRMDNFLLSIPKTTIYDATVLP